MIRKTQTAKTNRQPTRARMKGLSLIEALLALGIGGIVITQSIIGISSYTTGLQVQASASKLAILNRAADRYAEDNFGNLVAAAPQTLPISVLAPYVGENIGPDALGNSYSLTTRTYPITVEDPVNGGTTTQNGLQVLIVGTFDPLASPLGDTLTLRADIATAAGAATGFISQDELTCRDGANNPLPTGSICGAFGAYAFSAATFPAGNFANASVVSLVTKGDSTVYGDQLYRYSYGDPELNTMRTDLFMDENNIINPNDIADVNRITMNNGDGADAVIETTDATRDLRIRSLGRLQLEAGVDALTLNAASNAVTITANPTPPQADCGTTGCTNDFVRLGASNGSMRLDNASTVFGDRSAPYVQGASAERTGTGNVWANVARLERADVRSLNSLLPETNDALRIQNNRAFGETIFGRRVRTTEGGVTYEIADGTIRAQHAQVQDITCADCGGSLASVLPRWRHMGTYFIPNGGDTAPYARFSVPKPNCTSNRRSVTNRPAEGTNLPYGESGSDGRYVARIILIPRQLAFGGTDDSAEVNVRFRAIDRGFDWLAYTENTRANSSALAQTYCVFTGFDPNPASTRPDLPTSATPSFIVLE